MFIPEESVKFNMCLLVFREPTRLVERGENENVGDKETVLSLSFPLNSIWKLINRCPTQAALESLNKFRKINFTVSLLLFIRTYKIQNHTLEVPFWRQSEQVWLVFHFI